MGGGFANLLVVDITDKKTITGGRMKMVVVAGQVK